MTATAKARADAIVTQANREISLRKFTLRALEAALEDGERREDLGVATGVPGGSTMHTTKVGSATLTIRFEDGDEYEVVVIAAKKEA